MVCWRKASIFANLYIDPGARNSDYALGHIQVLISYLLGVQCPDFTPHFSIRYALSFVVLCFLMVVQLFSVELWYNHSLPHRHWSLLI